MFNRSGRRPDHSPSWVPQNSVEMRRRMEENRCCKQRVLLQLHHAAAASAAILSPETFFRHVLDHGHRPLDNQPPIYLDLPCVARSVTRRATIRRLKSRSFSPISPLQFRRHSDDPLAATTIKLLVSSRCSLFVLVAPVFCHRFHQIVGLDHRRSTPCVLPF
ncbi:hypothetical protein Salat_1158800 [Sesamum alatum]|uniref:Uncharacterized protein n=1 Tax=Sesamum alatum TaxID=300844 RepID=A0AAE1YE59_9LAMI|nr:hypothetical protein Salat_1158800 [Sesamum alatum]